MFESIFDQLDIAEQGHIRGEHKSVCLNTVLAYVAAIIASIIVSLFLSKVPVYYFLFGGNQQFDKESGISFGLLIGAFATAIAELAIFFMLNVFLVVLIERAEQVDNHCIKRFMFTTIVCLTLAEIGSSIYTFILLISYLKLQQKSQLFAFYFSMVFIVFCCCLGFAVGYQFGIKNGRKRKLTRDEQREIEKRRQEERFKRSAGQKYGLENTTE